ncbi:MAG: hypothetical protein V4568_14650 [Pseudomonadota bacterium]
METTTTSNLKKTPLIDDNGIQFGRSLSDFVGFYGATPVVQPTNASQAAVAVVTDGSSGSASATTGIQALTSSYNSGILSNTIATLAARVNANIALSNQMRADLVSLGLIKGS